MSGYKFAPLPSHSSVATLVTLSVSLWFAVAGAAIVTQPAGERYVGNGAPAAATAVRSAEAPAAASSIVRTTITVVAKRSMQGAAL